MLSGLTMTPEPPLCETLSHEALLALPVPERVLAFSQPGAKLHSILACAFDLPCRYEAVYTSKATITSDGHVMAGFTGLNGDQHAGAYVDRADMIEQNVSKLLGYMTSQGYLTAPERVEAVEAVKAWVATDYSGGRYPVAA